jgi:hypothetical protein
MSDIGTYKTLYEQIRPYAELIDKALVAIKSNQKDSPPLKEFDQLLGRMLTNKFQNASERILKLILRSKGMYDVSLLTDIKDHLQDQENMQTAISKVEQMAKVLEEEQNEAFGKIGGWMR